MTSRTPLRNDDVKQTRDTQRPVNESVRDLSIRLDEMPRREQAWLRFTVNDAGAASPLIGLTIRCPTYSVAAAIVLAVVIQDAPATVVPLTDAPWLSVEPVEGVTGTLRISDAFGMPREGTFDALVEFVENMTAVWPRTDVTGGTP